MSAHDRRVYLKICHIVEKWLVRLTVSLVILLIVSQCVLRFPEMRQLLLKVEKLEGRTYQYELSNKSTEIFARLL